MASKRNERRKSIRHSCTGKRAYVDRIIAGRTLYIVRRNTQDYALTIYHCRYCKMWHIGHLVTPPSWRKED